MTEYETTASFYDRLWKADRSFMVTDSAAAHFEIPVEAAAIRLFSPDGPLLISGSVRPQGLPCETSVPEDYLAFEKSGSTNRRWFKIKPRDHRNLIAENRSFVLRTREHAAEVDPDLLAGNFEWVRFEPSGNWIGNQLMVPVDSEPELQQRAANVMYYSIERDFEYPFEMTGDTFAMTKGKIVLCGDASPGRMKVFCNDRVVFDEVVQSTRGEIEFETGSLTGTLRVESESDVRMLVGGCYIGDVPCFMKRKAARMADGGLEFEFEKTTADDEVVTLLVFRNRVENDERCRLQVSIDDNGLREESGAVAGTEAWTIQDRIFDLRPIEGEASVLLDKEVPVDTGHRCRIQFGNDMPPGKYLIRVRWADEDREGHMLLYQTIPGFASTRSIGVVSSSVESP